MDGWLVGMTLCRHLKIISLSATIGPAIEKQAELKIGFERKERSCSKMPNCIWTCRQERFDRGVGGFKSCFGNVQIDRTIFKNKNTEAAQRCPIVFEHAGRGGSWQRLRFRVFALERLMLWKWEAALQFTEVTEPFAWTNQKSYVSNQFLLDPLYTPGVENMECFTLVANNWLNRWSSSETRIELLRVES